MDYNRLIYPWDEYMEDMGEKELFSKKAYEAAEEKWNEIDDALFDFVFFLTI